MMLKYFPRVYCRYSFDVKESYRILSCLLIIRLRSKETDNKAARKEHCLDIVTMLLKEQFLATDKVAEYHEQLVGDHLVTDYGMFYTNTVKFEKKDDLNNLFL